MKRRRWWFLVLLVLVAAGIAVILFLRSPYNFLRGPTQTQLVISSPSEGAAVPLHATLPVTGEAVSALGVRRLELWINSQLWAAEDFNIPQTKPSHVWAWTPSGEGTHVLLLRAVDVYGWTAESSTVTVYASAGFDVRFPLPYAAAGGETIAGLASEMGSDPQAILDSNPGLDPNSPLQPGQQLTIPVPIPNMDPVAPAGGAPPAAPASPLPPQPGNGAVQSGDSPSGGDVTVGGVVLKVPAEKVYAYVSLANGPWQRVPESTFTFLSASGGKFDIQPYVTPQMLGDLQLPVPYYAQLWGWAGGTLVYLGDQSGTLVAPPQQPAKSAAQLLIVGRINDSVSLESEWTIPRPIPQVYQGFDQGFQWTVSVPGVTKGVWQVATQPFPSDATYQIPGFVGARPTAAPKKQKLEISLPGFPLPPVEAGLLPASFHVDFAKYLDLPQPLSFWQQFLEGLNQAAEIQKQDGSLPTTFYVRVLPIMGSKLGQPSNTVIVHYAAPPPVQVTADTGPIYDVQVKSFTPYRAADPKYQACMVLQQDIQYCSTVYSLDQAALSGLNLHMQNVLKLAESSGTLELYKQQFPGVIVGSQKCHTTIPKGSQSCGCPGVSCSSGSSCSGNPMDWGNCVEWGFNQLKQAASWVSQKFEELKNYAVDLAMKFPGVSDLCGGLASDAACRAALKAGLEYGLASLGVPPTVPNFDTLMAEGKDYLTEMAIQEFKDQGFPCDSTCEAAIKGGVGKLTEGVSAPGAPGSGAGSGQAGFINWTPDPRGIEQPASMVVRLTRRPETAGIPETQTGVCSLIVWNGSTNGIYGVPLEGAPFIGLSMDVPTMQPGQSMDVPVVFQRMAWSAPQGLTLKTSSGSSIQPPSDPKYGAWSLLYYGSTVTFDLRGPVFSTTGSDGKKVSVACMQNQKFPVQIPVP